MYHQSPIDYCEDLSEASARDEAAELDRMMESAATWGTGHDYYGQDEIDEAADQPTVDLASADYCFLKL